MVAARSVSVRPRRYRMPNRNVLYLVIGALVVIAGMLGYNLYQEIGRAHV